MGVGWGGWWRGGINSITRNTFFKFARSHAGLTCLILNAIDKVQKADVNTIPFSFFKFFYVVIPLVLYLRQISCSKQRLATTFCRCSCRHVGNDEDHENGSFTSTSSSLYVHW